MSDRQDDQDVPQQTSEHQVDRSGSDVTAPSRRQLTTGKKLGLAALVLVLSLSFIWFQQLTKGQGSKQQDLSVTSNVAAFRPAPIAPPPPGLPMPAQTLVAEPPPQPQPQSANSQDTAASSGIFAFSGGGAQSAAQAVGNVQATLTGTSPAAQAAAAAAAAKTAAAGGTGPLVGNLQPTTMTGVTASLLPHPDMLVTEGTIIACTLQTAIDSQLAGYVKCVLPQDVRGTTGNVVLLDRGTTVVGEIQHGLMNGQDRLFILWDRAETPEHVIVQLSSPATDELGRSGITGTVDTHFWQRFGSAIMLSVIQSVLSAGSSYASNLGNTAGTSFSNVQSSGQQMSDTALQASINIPPTLEQNQGTNVAIFVAKDLDFSSVYALRPTN